MKKTVAPTKGASPHSALGDTTYSHPAFGCVVVNRWQSSGRHRLFGSDLGHSVGVSLEFHEATEHRGLSSDGHFSGKVLLRVDMSESQWARFVASSGMGSGTPVTIAYKRDGDLIDVPAIAMPEATKREIHGEEMAESLRKRLDALKTLTARFGEMLDGGRTGKTELREIQRELARHVEQTPGSVQFVYDQFARATEQVAEDAKTEVEAHVMGVATRLGLDRLQEMAPQLSFNSKGENP